MKAVKRSISVVTSVALLTAMNAVSSLVRSLKTFSKRWQKHGQNFVENQELLKRVGSIEFLKIFNDKINRDT